MAKAYVKHDYKITGKDFVEVDDSDLPVGNVDYSLEEQPLGVKWLNGKEVYQITIQFTAGTTPGTGIVVARLEDYRIDDIIYMNGAYTDGMPLNFNAVPANNTYWSLVQTQRALSGLIETVYVVTGAKCAGKDGYLTLMYTKADPE